MSSSDWAVISFCLCSVHAEVVELVYTNSITHAKERQHDKNVAPGNDQLVTLSTTM